MTDNKRKQIDLFRSLINKYENESDNEKAEPIFDVLRLSAQILYGTGADKYIRVQWYDGDPMPFSEQLLNIDL